MAAKTECYVDTSALIALLDRSDSYHPVFTILFTEPPPLVASALVIAEGHGWFLRRYDQHRAVQFLRFIETLPAFTVIPFDMAALRKAGGLVRRYADQKLTLADSHGLAIMHDRRISTCWSTDRHLGLGGATLVI